MNQWKPEQIVHFLHQVDQILGKGKYIEDICQEHQITLDLQDSKKLKALEVENAKLKRLLAEVVIEA